MSFECVNCENKSEKEKLDFFGKFRCSNCDEEGKSDGGEVKNSLSDYKTKSNKPQSGGEGEDEKDKWNQIFPKI